MKSALRGLLEENTLQLDTLQNKVAKQVAEQILEVDLVEKSEVELSYTDLVDCSHQRHVSLKRYLLFICC